MYQLARSLLFRLNPETAHNLTLDMLGAGQRLGLLKLGMRKTPDAPVKVMGIDFPNPVGLAAGMDKDGDCIDAFGAMGFGFIEVGTVTPLAQPGNPSPRLFRLVEHEGIINRMGFNNHGVEHLVGNLRKAHTNAVIGVNIGKNKITPLEKANDDYLTCLRAVYPWAGYIAVNLSSPNTPGLRELQFGEHLRSLLSALKEEQTALADKYGRYVPIAIKLAPDMTDDELREIAGELVACGMDGVIATNTTLERESVASHPYSTETGGLSGAPLTSLSTAKIRVLAEALEGKLPIIGVGGIMNAGDAAEKIKAGASLVQLYTGFIYRGPTLIADASEAAYLELRKMDKA
ncbi:quinone-dependent dihydroorotate dehydrogenase [Sansalvadorimonas sp. 2012CJ34-2]|uniref:Dihydroorotate dehydrogenase (quinone) n=1 Tax=Parendozoicomonas callyspongiae TaxID=2942213 RepID=A0ABT0PEP9_9GAMM|nr:quinone-dependent dihydroorotate dehydrogenase [Sansalvadorimonas sp. 2012CJ34-2]MCL6269783.1 quinone-dependent dihydroorotate dehydrogenase [Sansalvadorimonas sp. 2012CJ34-2]